MKKTYYAPEMIAVKLQHLDIICMSTARSITSDELDFGGASSNNSEGNVRVKEQSSIWDDEW